MMADLMTCKGLKLEKRISKGRKDCPVTNNHSSHKFQVSLGSLLQTEVLHCKYQ